MKTLAIVLIALATAGLVVAADAETGSSPSGSASGSVSTPSGSASGPGSTSPGVTADRPGGAVSGGRAQSRDEATQGDGAALPRSAVTERTTIFGLSPTAAVIIAAALLVVVVLAIVAMTRTGDTYIDTDRRL